jgi:tetratricopeptide (TPR) repeat protein
MSSPGATSSERGAGLMRTAAIVILVAVLLATAAGMQSLRESRYGTPPEVEASLYITRGAASNLTKGYAALAADLYWIRTIQYYGDLKRRLAEPAGSDASTDGFPLLYGLLDNTTTLDPRFSIAYRFGAIFLAEAQPRGAGRPDLAIALLEKGLRARPDKWEYMQDIGFVHYWWRHDYPAAAIWFNRAADVPGAPWWVRSLAAVTLAAGGDRQSSRTMWQSIRERADNDWLKNDAERRLQQLDALEFIEALQQRLDAFRQQTGRTPDSWEPLVRARAIAGVPVDAANVPFEINAAGQVVMSARSPLFPLPEEPEHLAPPPS